MAISTNYSLPPPHTVEISSTHYSWKKLQSLGQGDQAEVFLVEEKSGCFFALKCFFSKEEQVSRLPAEVVPFLFKDDGTPFSALHEWDVAQQLRHPNLLQYRELVTGPETTLLMEYVQGKTLSDIPSKTFDLPTTLTLLAEAADVLQYALSKGWIHHDLHSTNAMVDSGQHLKLIDLGSFDLVESSAEADETLEDEQKNLWLFFSSILEKGNLTAEEKEKIVQILQAPFASSYWGAGKQNQLSSKSASLFSAALREIAGGLDEMRRATSRTQSSFLEIEHARRSVTMLTR